MPAVSVIVPLYNKGPYVKRALDSITAQTFQDFEIVVVDDGSTDNGPALVEQLAQVDSRIRLIRQENAGPGAARNRGLADAQASFVAFLDGDDEWLPEHLSLGIAALNQTGAGAASTSVINLPDEGSQEPIWIRRRLPMGVFRATPDTSPSTLVDAVAFMHPCSTIARTEAVRRHGGFFEAGCRYAEDAHLWVKFLMWETAHFTLKPQVNIWRNAAALSGNLAGARPVEPFLDHPETVRANCPPELRSLLDGFLSIRAFKTACVLGYWGHWRRAAEIRSRFRSGGDWRLDYYWPSLICETPIGAGLGAVARAVRGS